MLRSELLEIIANGENSGVEFKRDDIRPEQFAKEVVALANFQGGRILLGVEDDGTISGLRRPNTEEWVMNIFRDLVHPLLLPFYEEVQIDEALRVAIVSFPTGVAKPYVLRHRSSEDIYIRVGTTSRLATREQQARLHSSGGFLHTELLPVAGTSLRTLDRARLTDYIRDVIDDSEIPETDDEWETRALSLGLLVPTDSGPVVCSVAGLVLFGMNPRRFLRQAGVRLIVFAGPDKDYDARLDITLDAPLVARWHRDNEGRRVVDPGLVERFTEHLTAHICTVADPNSELRRDRVWAYPMEAIREVVLNALTHRDWTRNIEVEVVVYSDRLEVTSPGTLPNSMTVTKMIAGQRSPRNSIITDIMRDYGYVDARGMGVRRKILPLMRQQNHSEPIFESTDDFLRTTLRNRLTEEQIPR